MATTKGEIAVVAAIEDSMVSRNSEPEGGSPINYTPDGGGAMPLWMCALLGVGAVAVVARFLGAPPFLIFALSAAGLVPMAALIGRSTEDLAHHIGPKLGGLLNATFGNAAELI